MKYHYEPRKVPTHMYGKTYMCNHPLYSDCTLYTSHDGRGLAVIQQRFDPATKKTWWTKIDDEIVDRLYLAISFSKYFKNKAGRPVDGLYPTVTLRQAMWALRLKPLKKQPWETVFDRSLICPAEFTDSLMKGE